MHRTDPVRWGIVGTGVIAAEFARVFPIVKSATLAAIASRDEVRAEAFAREHSAAWFHGSYEALFADPDIDAVYIATPHSHHATNAIAALRAGKAVLCEKPLTPTLTEAQAVVDVARQTGGYLAEGMWTYFLPAIQTARRWVADGRIGRVLRIHADFGYPQPYDPASRFYDPALAGGALLDMGVYPVALAWLFLESHPGTIVAHAHRAPTGVDAEVSLRFDYPDVTATLAASFRCKLPNAAFIVGDTGLIRIPDFFRAHACTLFHGDAQVDHFDEGRTSHGFEHELRAVSADVLAGRQQSSVVPWTATLAVMGHMERALRLLAQDAAQDQTVR